MLVFIQGGKFLSTACGSPCYAAPEMIAGKKYFGPMADMWSMGVILFALVCGYLPFEDQNTSILYKKILSGRYSAPDWISMGVRDLIRKILETDPLKRFSIRDVRKHPWYAIVKDRDLPHDTLSISDNEHLKAEALSAMRTAGLDVEATVEALKSKTCNALTANYYLFFQKSRAQCNYVIKIEDLTHLPQESAQELLEQQLSAKGPSKQPSPQPQAPTTEPPSAARPVRVAPLKSAKNEIAIATEEQPVKDGDKGKQSALMSNVCQQSYISAVVEELEVSEVKSAKLSPKPPLRADNNVADASRRASDAFNSPFPAAAIKQREEVPSSKSTTVRATQHEHRPSKPDITKPDLQPVRKYSGPSSKSTHLKHHNPSKQNSSQGLKECNAPLELVSISNAAAKLRQYQDHQKRLETQLLLKEIEQNKRVEQLLPKSDVKSIPTKVDDIKATAVPVETKISYLNSKPQPSKASANRNGSSDGNGAEDVLEKRVSITNGSITNDDNNDQAEVVTKMARLQFKKEGGNEFLNERMWPLVETVKTEPAPEPMEVCTNVDVAEDNDGRPSTRRNSRTKKDAGKEIIAREVQASGKLDTEPIVTVNNKKHPLKSDGDDDNDKQLEIRGTKPVEQPMPTKPIGNTNTSGHNLGRGRYGRNIISVNHRNSV
jgi:serine/threonine protein kinase